MKVNFDHATGEHIVRLAELEAIRIIGVILYKTGGHPDPNADTSAQLEDALTEVLT